MTETGNPSGASDRPPGAGTASGPEERALRSLGQLLGESADLARDYLDLLAVEGQLAGRSLVMMLALAIVLAILLMAAWVFLNLAAAVWLVDQGLLTTWQALLAVTATHALAALMVWISVRRLSRNLGFGGMRRALNRVKPEAGPEGVS